MGSNVNLSFEQILDKLKETVSVLEQSDLPIDKAIEWFEQGVQLTKQAESKLNEIKDKVIKIVKDSKEEEVTIEE